MKNILVCDDDRSIVESIEIYLQQEGFRVLKAYDAEAGRDPDYAKDPGKQQYTHYHFVCKDRGCG